jgi:antitoxin component YwqK of YwqJK toxin-antitoxin module
MKYLLIFAMILGSLVACQSPGEEKTPESKVANPKAETKKPVGNTSNMHREYHENGQLKLEGPMVDGKRHGLWKSWYENGLKWSETTFSHGVKSGPTITYYENGMMRYNGEYLNDERVGLWNFYNEDGILEKKVDHDAVENN